jgi:hypothetical protein
MSQTVKPERVFRIYDKTRQDWLPTVRGEEALAAALGVDITEIPAIAILKVTFGDFMVTEETHG